jgi:hypothetical protein
MTTLDWTQQHFTFSNLAQLHFLVRICPLRSDFRRRVAGTGPCHRSLAPQIKSPMGFSEWMSYGTQFSVV